MNTGQLCKIHQLIQLKHQYKLRLFIDESVSFGSLGKHGKGITEHEKISVINSLSLLLNISMWVNLKEKSSNHFIWPYIAIFCRWMIWI